MDESKAFCMFSGSCYFSQRRSLHFPSNPACFACLETLPTVTYSQASVVNQPFPLQEGVACGDRRHVSFVSILFSTQHLPTKRTIFLQGKIYNCGGGGSCGTCAVNVVAGASNCSPKGPGEKKLLDKKPDSYRLSCCTMVSGPVTVKTKP